MDASSFSIGAQLHRMVVDGIKKEDDFGELGKSGLKDFREYIDNNKEIDMSKLEMALRLEEREKAKSHKGLEAVESEKFSEVGEEALRYYENLLKQVTEKGMDVKTFDIGAGIHRMINDGIKTEEELPELGKRALMYFRENTEEISKTEQSKTETPVTRKQIESLEAQLRASADRMKEYKSIGDYNQEALEHQYYNQLIQKLDELKKSGPIIDENDFEETKPEEIVEEPKKKSIFGKVKDFFKGLGKSINEKLDWFEDKIGLRKKVPQITSGENIEKKPKTEREEFVEGLNARDLLDKFYKAQDEKEEMSDELYIPEDVKEAMAKVSKDDEGAR